MTPTFMRPAKGWGASASRRERGPDVLTDIEIAQAATPQPISAIAQKAGVPEQYLEQYGTTKAKVDYNLLRDEQHLSLIHI